MIDVVMYNWNIINGEYQTFPILSKKHSRILYWTSFVPLFSSAYAILNGLWLPSMIPTSVAISSVLYWNHPDYSWRRYFDIGVVQVGFYGLVYLALFSSTYLWFYMIEAIAIFIFIYGIYLFELKKYYESTLCQASLHVLATIANVILFAGL